MQKAHGQELVLHSQHLQVLSCCCDPDKSQLWVCRAAAVAPECTAGQALHSFFTAKRGLGGNKPFRGRIRPWPEGCLLTLCSFAQHRAYRNFLLENQPQMFSASVNKQGSRNSQLSLLSRCYN